LKLNKNSLFVIGIVYFIILLVIALWVRDISNQPDVFTLTLQQLISVSPMGDPTYFAKAALDVAENGFISSENVWIFNLWPPGFVLVEALIIKVFGINAPVILILQICASVLFAFALTLLFEYLKKYVRSEMAFILPLLIFLFPVSRVFLLEPTGISLGESFSIGFFFIFILLTIRSVEKKALKIAVYAGVSLALTAYFRSQFELILLALTGWAILLMVALKWTPLSKVTNASNANTIIKTIAVVIAVAHITTFPWRVYHWVNQGAPQWVFTSSVTFGNSVKTSEELRKVGGGFVVDGGGNLVCRIDPKTCGDLTNAKSLFIKTFIENPIEWYSLKLEVIGKYWFSSLQNWSSISVDSTHIDIIVNSVLLIFLIGILFMLLTRKIVLNKLWLLLVWINVSLLSTYFLIFTVQQFEARYFYFPKIQGVMMLLIVFVLYFRRNGDSDNN